MAPSAIFAVLAVALVARVDAQALQAFVSGGPAVIGEFPYQASLRIRDQHYCSGAIVSQRHILTTAHCVAASSGLIVVTGTISNSTQGQKHTPARIEYHPGYQSTAVPSPYDIAVITLRRNIVFDKFQDKIALPTEPVQAGFMVTSTGYGFINTSPPTTTLTLNKINLPTISRVQCQRTLHPLVTINTHQICTYSGPNFCLADNGGLLIFNGTLIGLLSFGTPCTFTTPDVFTSVYSLLSWVNDTMEIH